MAQPKKNDGQAVTPAEQLRICMWLIEKFPNIDDVLPMMKTALKAVKDSRKRQPPPPPPENLLPPTIPMRHDAS